MSATPLGRYAALHGFGRRPCTGLLTTCEANREGRRDEVRMKRLFAIAVLASVPALLGWGDLHDRHSLEWPHSGLMPDDPVKVKPSTYVPITTGNQSYRPIDPLPWGDVNRRVAPPGSLPGAPPVKGQRSGTAPAAPGAPRAAVPVPIMPAPTSPIAPIPTSPIAPIPASPLPAAPMDHSKHGGPTPPPEAKKP